MKLRKLRKVGRQINHLSLLIRKCLCLQETWESLQLHGLEVLSRSERERGRESRQTRWVARHCVLCPVLSSQQMWLLSPPTMQTEDVDGDSSEKILGQKQKQIPTVVILPQPRTGTEVLVVCGYSWDDWVTVLLWYVFIEESCRHSKLPPWLSIPGNRGSFGYNK